MNRIIEFIVIHCTATPQTTSIESIIRYWKNNLKWNSPGYHAIIKPSGEIVWLADLDQVTNGVKGYNSKSINISYIGGVTDGRNPQPVDNRTIQQKASMIKLIDELKKKYPKAKVLGHRDFPKVAKDCPSFDVKKWLEEMLNKNILRSIQ